MRDHLKEFMRDGRIVFIGTMWVLYLAAIVATGWNGWTWVWLAAGVAIFFFIEYFVHRFVLHGFMSKLMPKAHMGHEKHHEHPNEMEYLLTPNSYNIPYHLGLSVAFAAAFQSVHIAGAIMLGIGTLQMYYEWTHFVSHRPIVPNTRWGKWMKKHHLLHHFKSSEAWYGVTNPAFDKLFGTDDDSSLPNRPRKDNTLHS